MPGTPLYRLHDDPPHLDAPVLVAAFDGWVDGGKAGTLAAEQLATGGTTLATFDADAIFDFRARRPTLDIIDGKPVSLDWAELTLTASTLEGHDLLVLTGAEPDYRWHQLADDVLTLARLFAVGTWISLGAIPSAVAHTRPVPVLGTSSAPGLLPAGTSQGPEGHLRVPAAALSVFEHHVSQAGIPAIGFFAQVPHYASGAFPNGAIELLRHVGRFLDAELPMGDLPRQALENRSLLDAAVAADERTRAYVTQLERAADEARLPSGEDLIADIERFLREGGGRSGGDDGGGLPN
ncbi:MAG TPA: PAC2 family protein [Candidatus Limnocylindria bacterium]